MTSTYAHLGVASSAEFHEGHTRLAVAVASILVDAEGRETIRATRYFAGEIDVGGGWVPATASAAELVAVALALETAPRGGPLTIQTQSEVVAATLATRHGVLAYPVLTSFVRAGLESRGARLVYRSGGAGSSRSAGVLASEALARSNAEYPTAEGQFVRQRRAP